MNVNLFLVAFAVGAAAVAWWIDARFPGLAPESFRGSLVHAAISIVVSYFVAPLAIKEGAATGAPELILLAVFGVGLPALVYSFLAALWVMKLLAGQLRGFPR